MAFGITLINHNNIKIFKHLEEINWSFSFYFCGWMEFFTRVHHFIFFPNWEEKMKEMDLIRKVSNYSTFSSFYF